MDWWQELLVFSNQKGAVTAEFMLLFPTVVLALAGFFGGLSAGAGATATIQRSVYPGAGIVNRQSVAKDSKHQVSE